MGKKKKKEVLPARTDWQGGETKSLSLPLLLLVALYNSLPKLVTLDFPLKTSRMENFFHDLVPHKHMYLISNLNLFGFNFQSRGTTIVSLINC